jgi:hypothetical protein
METLIQEQTSDYSIDLAQIVGTIESVDFRLYKGNAKNTIAKFMYPETEGYIEITKEGAVYSFTLPTEITDANEGVFGWEMKVITEEGKVVKSQIEGVQINKKAKDAPVES